MFVLFYMSGSKLVETKIDKSWIDCSRASSEYEKWLIEFVNFAIKNVEDASDIRCPCYKCRNLAFRTPTIVTEHLYWHGFVKSYKIWKWHREDGRTTPSCNIDVNTFASMDFNYGNTVHMVNDAYKDCDGDLKAFRKLLE